MISFKVLMWSLVYLIGLNLYTAILMWFDKRSAQNGKWRIAEKQLAILSLLGGSVGTLVGMVMFRHKTKHKSFYLGLPLILLIQCVTLLSALFYAVNKGL